MASHAPTAGAMQLSASPAPPLSVAPPPACPRHLLVAPPPNVLQPRQRLATRASALCARGLGGCHGHTRHPNCAPLIPCWRSSWWGLSMGRLGWNPGLAVVPSLDASAQAQAEADAAAEAQEEAEADADAEGNAALESRTAVGAEFIVINFYKLTQVQEPQECVQQHLHFLQAHELDIKGRIYLSSQGINAQLSGPSADALAYANWVREDPRFADVALQVSPSPSGHAFPRLRLRHKESLVQVVGGISSLPITEPSQRAVPLSPAEWRAFLERAEASPSADSAQRRVLVLDVRNGYEWDVGHFRGAVRPPVDNFRSTEFGLGREGSSPYPGEEGSSLPPHNGEGEGELPHRDLTEEFEPRGNSHLFATAAAAADPPCTSTAGNALALPRACDPHGPRAIVPPELLEEAGEGGDPLGGVDPETTDILMYCTGGIRCDVYSTLLRERGFQNLYSLEGGVAQYLKEEGTEGGHWKGHLFVFDSRLAVHPTAYQQSIGPNGGQVSPDSGGATEEYAGEDAIVSCTLCGGGLEMVRHRNCANPDCNALILMCTDCARSLRGACSNACADSDRIRPFLEVPEPYKRRHLYEAGPPRVRPPGYVSKRALKRRQRRLALKQDPSNALCEQTS